MMAATVMVAVGGDGCGGCRRRRHRRNRHRRRGVATCITNRRRAALCEEETVRGAPFPFGVLNIELHTESRIVN